MTDDWQEHFYARKQCFQTFKSRYPFARQPAQPREILLCRLRNGWKQYTINEQKMFVRPNQAIHAENVDGVRQFAHENTRILDGQLVRSFGLFVARMVRPLGIFQAVNSTVNHAYLISRALDRQKIFD